jgi:putative oxidoreductase
MDRFGVPGVFLPAVIAVELTGGLMIAVGWQTRLAAVVLALFSVLAACLFPANFSDRNQLLHFEKDLAIAGGLLVLAIAGPGRWSVEGSAGEYQTVDGR